MLPDVLAGGLESAVVGRHHIKVKYRCKEIDIRYCATPRDIFLSQQINDGAPD